MCRKILSALLALLLCVSLAVCVSATTSDRDETSVLYDGAELLTPEEKIALRDKLWELSWALDTQIVIVTVDSTSGDIDTYAEYVYDTMDFGYGETREAVLLLVCMDIREFQIFSKGYAGNVITAGRIDQICDLIVDDMSYGNYYEAFENFADECAYYLEGNDSYSTFNWGKTLIIALIIGLVMGFIVAFGLKAQLKTVRMKERADFYLKKDSLKITTQRDMFLYRDVKRTRKESSKSSSGGGSRSSGGRSF